MQAWELHLLTFHLQRQVNTHCKDFVCQHSVTIIIIVNEQKLHYNVRTSCYYCKSG